MNTEIENAIANNCDIGINVGNHPSYGPIGRHNNHTDKGFWGDCKKGCWIVVCNHCGWLRHEGSGPNQPCANCGSPMHYPPGAEW